MTQNEHVYAICFRPKVAGDVISGGNVSTIDGYVLLNFEAASAISFRANQNNKSPQIVGLRPAMCSQFFFNWQTL